MHKGLKKNTNTLTHPVPYRNNFLGLVRGEAGPCHPRDEKVRQSGRLRAY